MMKTNTEKENPFRKDCMKVEMVEWIYEKEYYSAQLRLRRGNGIK